MDKHLIWKCSLIEANGFKVIKEKKFKYVDLPISKLDKPKTFTYKWIVTQFFNDHIIEDMQCNGSDGQPDFEIWDKDLKNKCYVEFKSPRDALQGNQILWFSKNNKEKIYILLCEENNEFMCDQDLSLL